MRDTKGCWKSIPEGSLISGRNETARSETGESKARDISGLGQFIDKNPFLRKSGAYGVKPPQLRCQTLFILGSKTGFCRSDPVQPIGIRVCKSVDFFNKKRECIAKCGVNADIDACTASDLRLIDVDMDDFVASSCPHAMTWLCRRVPRPITRSTSVQRSCATGMEIDSGSSLGTTPCPVRNATTGALSAMPDAAPPRHHPAPRRRQRSSVPRAGDEPCRPGDSVAVGLRHRCRQQQDLSARYRWTASKD